MSGSGSLSPTGGATRTVKRWVRGAIFAFSGLCFAWVLWPIWRHARELGETIHAGPLVGWIVAGAGAYAFFSVLLGLGWWWLSGIYGSLPSPRTGYAIWARSQLAKYLPGNAFQFVSRQILGREIGLSHPALVASGLLEMGSQLLAAVLIAVAGAALSRWSTPASVSLLWVVLLGAGSLLAWPAIDALLRRIPRTASWMAELPRLSVGQTLRLLGPAIALYALFFLTTGSLVFGLLVGGWGEAPVGLWRVIWLYAVAWAVGTVTVGAPAGVGVREAILTLQLEPLIGAANAAALAVVLRLVTTAGDLVTALVGWSLRDPRMGPPGPSMKSSPETKEIRS